MVYLHDMSALGDRVARAREDKEWSQRELAERVTAAGYKIGQSGIGNIESGQTKDPKCLPWLADVLGVSHDFLVSGREKATGSAHGVNHQSAMAGVEPWQNSDRQSSSLIMWKAYPAGGAIAGAFMLSRQKGRPIPRPSFLDGEDNAFSFQLVGRDNEPAYWAGDTLYVNPDKDVEESRDYVFLQSPDKSDGVPSIVGHLVRITDRLWIIRQWSSKLERELPRREWTVAWRIVGRRHRQ